MKSGPIALIVVNAQELWLFSRATLGCTCFIPLVQSISRLWFVAPQWRISYKIGAAGQMKTRTIKPHFLLYFTQGSIGRKWCWYRSYVTSPETRLAIRWESLFDSPCQNCIKFVLKQERLFDRSVDLIIYLITKLQMSYLFPGWGPRSKWSMKIPIQTIFAYENTQADQKCLWSRLCLVQNFGAFMCSFKNAYEKTCTDKNAIWYRLWLVPFMKRLRKTEKLYDPDFGSFNFWKDWS